MSTKKWSPGVAIAQVPLKDLKETFFVRVALDEKHVIYLAQIIESGVELPPIVAVKGTNEIVFGRHRKAAYQRLGRISALVEFRTYKTVADMIAAAFADNVGGALPPTSADIDHTIRLLLDQGLSGRQISDLLSKRASVPTKLFARHVKAVNINAMKTRARQAVRAVAKQGLTVEEAARQYKVNPDAVQDKLLDVAGDDDTMAIKEVKGEVASKFRSLASSNGKVMEKLFKQFEDGVVDEGLVREVIKDMSQRIERLRHSNEDWTNRLDAKTGNVAPVKSESPGPRKSTSTNGSAEAALRKMGLKK